MMSKLFMIYLACYLHINSGEDACDTVGSPPCQQYVSSDEADARRQLFENSLTPFIHQPGTPPGGDVVNLEERMTHWRVAGCSIAIMKDYQLDWAKGYGLERPGGPPVSIHTRFQVASSSKFVTASNVMKRVEQGIFDLDENINEKLDPEYQLPDNEFTTVKKVTLRGIMSHTSGLSQSTYPGYALGEQVPTIYQILKGEPPSNTLAVVPIYEPGTRDRYSGGGNVVEQVMIQKFLNREFEDLMQEEVLDPLGMRDSSFKLRDRSNLTDVASGCECQNEAATPFPGHWRHYKAQATAGLWSTPTDMLKFSGDIARAYHGMQGTLLSQDTVRQMLTIQLDDPEKAPMQFGLGPNLIPIGDTRWFHHWGYNVGYCLFFLTSTDGLGIMLATNGDCTYMQPFMGEVYRSFVDIYQAEDLKNNTHFPSTMPYIVRLEADAPLTGPQDYEGVYELPDDSPEHSHRGYRRVHVTSGTIKMDDPKACTYRLYPHPERGDRFYADVLEVYPIMTVVEHGIPIKFTRSSGKIVGLQAHYEDNAIFMTKTGDVNGVAELSPGPLTTLLLPTLIGAIAALDLSV